MSAKTLRKAVLLDDAVKPLDDKINRRIRNAGRQNDNLRIGRGRTNVPRGRPHCNEHRAIFARRGDAQRMCVRRRVRGDLYVFGSVKIDSHLLTPLLF